MSDPDGMLARTRSVLRSLIAAVEAEEQRGLVGLALPEARDFLTETENEPGHVARCDVLSPQGDRLCDLFPEHAGPHANANGFEWKQRASGVGGGQ